MATAREGKPYEGEGGLGTGGKFRKNPYRRTHSTPYDRPPTALRNPRGSFGWVSKIVDPAQRLISSGAQKIFSSVFRKRLLPPPTPIPPPAPSTFQEPSPPKSPSQELNQEESRKHVEPVRTDVRGKQEEAIGHVNCQSSSDGSFLTEIEQLLKQKTFTRSEIDSLTALLRSRTMETSIGDDAKRHEDNSLEPNFSNEHKDKPPEKTALENGAGNHQVSYQITGSMSQDLDDDFGSPAALAKAYMASKPSQASPALLSLQNQSHLKDSNYLDYQSTPASSPTMSIFPWNSSHVGNVENGLTSAKCQGRSAMYKMARIPYSRVHPSSALKGVELKHDVYTRPSTSSRSAWDHDSLSATRHGALKRRNSVLENDIGSVGPIRRIRHKPNLLTYRGSSLQVSGSTLSMSGIRAGTDGTQSVAKQCVLHDEATNSCHAKRSSEKIHDTNTTPSRSLPPPSSKSSEMASKILQQLDKMVPSKDKVSDFNFPNLRDNSPQMLSPSMLRGQALHSLEHVESSRFLEAHEDISKVEKSVNNSSPSSLSMHVLKQEKVDTGPSKLMTSFGDPASSKKNTLSGSVLLESSVVKFAAPPQNKRAFHMSAHEDYLDVDDESYPNGTASSLSPKGKDIVDTKPVVDQKATDSRRALENSLSVDGKSKYDSPEGSLFAESSKISAPQFGFSSSLSEQTRLQSTLVSEKAALRNQSDAACHASPLFSRGNGVESSVEQKASIPISGGDKFVSSGEPVADLSNVVSNKSVNSLQVPCTISSIGESIPIFKGDKLFSSEETAAPSSNVFSNKNVDSTKVTFSTPVAAIEKSTFSEANSVSKPPNSSSTALAGTTDSTPKVSEIDKANGKNNSFAGVFGRLSEATDGTASTPVPSTGLFSFSNSVNNSNPMNGPLLTSGPSFSSSIPAVPTDNISGKHPLSSSSLNATETAVSIISSASSTTSAATPVFNHSVSISSNSVAAPNSFSTSLSEPPFAAPSFPKFGISAFPTALEKPVSSTSDKSIFAASTNSAATSGQGTVFGSLSGTVFGGSSLSSGSAECSTFGFTSASASSSGNLSQSSTFSGQASAATGFPSFTQSMPSSASSTSTGLANNFGSSMFSASTQTSVFSSASSFAFNAVPASSSANFASSSSAPSTGIFSSSSWQPSKSTFTTSFTSSAPSSLFTFGSSATSTATSTITSPTSLPSAVFSFGAGTASGAPSTTASSSSLFPFTSSPATTSTQLAFSSPGPTFPFGSPAPPNNSEMNMEDSMAEDGVQGSTTPAPPAFPQQPVAPISNFTFSSSTNPFQFGGQQNISASQNPSPFQPASSLDFSGGGSFSLGSGGGDKSNRRIVKVNRNRQRKK